MPAESRSKILLDLPLELREQIYQDVLLSTKSDFRLLQTCRSIHTEAFQFLFKRPLIFRSQGALIQWANTVGTEHLHHVTDLTLCLVDMTRPQLTPRQDACDALIPLGWEFYESELRDLFTVMSSLPNLQSLNMTSPRVIQPPSRYLDFEKQFLHTLSQYFANLTSLVWYGDHQALSFIGSLRNLRSFEFTGFSQTSPQELTKLLSNQSSLKELKICPCSFETTLGSRVPPPDSCHIERSFSPDLFEHMNHLRSVTFHENAIWSDAPYTFFTRDYIDALKLYHIDSIQSIKIRLDFPPAADSLAALQDLLTCSSIKNFGIGWTGMDPGLLSILVPPTMESLEVYIDSPAAALRIMQAVLEYRISMPYLERLLLVANSPTCSTDTRHTTFDISKKVPKRVPQRDKVTKIPCGSVIQSDLEKMRMQLFLQGIEILQLPPG